MYIYIYKFKLFICLFEHYRDRKNLKDLGWELGT